MGTKYRPKISTKNKYWISKHRFYEIQHHCLQYKEWKDEYDTLECQGAKGVDYDNMPHGNSVGDPTSIIAMRKIVLKDKIDLVEKTAHDAEPSLAKYILTAVTNEGISYNYLELVMGIPCKKDMYYDRRRKFYWLMNQRM